MVLHEGDAVVVLHLAGGHVLGDADAVLGDVYGQVVAARDLDEAAAQTVRVDLGAPLGRLHVGIVEHLLEPVLDDHALAALERRAGVVHHKGRLAVGIGFHEHAGVVVEAEEVDRSLAQHGELLGRDVGQVEPAVKIGEQIDRQLAGSGGVEHPVVGIVVGKPHGDPGLEGVVHAVDRAKAVHDAHRALVAAFAEGLDAQRRGVHDVEGRVRALLGILQRRRVVADEVPAHDEPLGLVECRPVAHAIAEALEAHPGVVLVGAGGLLVEPAAKILPVLREVPMVDGHERLDVELDAGVDEAVVEGDALLIDLALAVLDDARPREREAVGVLAALCHGLDILAVAVIVVACHITVLKVVLVQVAVPHRLGLAALLPCAFALVGRGGASPEKRFGVTHASSLGPLGRHGPALMAGRAYALRRR